MSAPLAQDEAQRRAYELAQLRLARMRVAGGDSLADALRETTRVAAETLGIARVSVWLFVDERRAIRCHQAFERSPGRHVEGAVLRAADFPRYFAALSRQREVPADDARESETTSELREAYLDPLGIRALLDVPLYRGGEVVGVVCHEDRAVRHWTAEERSFAVSVGETVARQMEEHARRDAEARLGENEHRWAELEKMEALGQLAAGVAHDFRNLLTVVIGSAHEIRRRSPDGPIAEAADQILASARRGADLVTHLLSFGREEKSEARVLDVAAALETMRGVLRTAAGSQHPVAICCDRPIGRVLIDRSQLERVVLNLVLNARDAQPGGGPIEITLRETDVPAEAGEPSTYVVLEIADRGDGMDRETQSRIFEPFFTTKGARGTGIGLSVVYRVVERAGGFLHVDSAPGRGTRIRAYLPRVSADAG